MPHSEELGGCNGALNQYWYSAHTTATLVSAIESCVGKEGRVAFCSTPSLFFAVSPELRARSRLLEYDKRWSDREEFRFFDFHEGAGGISSEDSGQFDLCVIDPPFIDKKVWRFYMEAAQKLLGTDGHLLLTTIPENEPMLASLWSKLSELGGGMSSDIRRHTFVPVNAECLHRFAVFTTFDSEALSVINEEPVPDNQGLGQVSVLSLDGCPSQANQARLEVDEVEDMFGGLQAAVISMHLDQNDSDHESEPDVVDEPQYEFDEKARIVVRKEAPPTGAQ